MKKLSDPAAGFTPKRLYGLFAKAEMVTWALLLLALLLRALDVANIVPIAGGIHGFVFLSYFASTIFVWVNQKWRLAVGVPGLLLAIVPFATVPYEHYLERKQLLEGGWRLAPGGAEPRGFVEHVQAWVLRHLALALVLLLVLVTVVFLVLLWLGPPGGKA